RGEVPAGYGDPGLTERVQGRLEPRDLVACDLLDLRFLEMRPHAAEPRARRLDLSRDRDDVLGRSTATAETRLNLELHGEIPGDTRRRRRGEQRLDDGRAPGGDGQPVASGFRDLARWDRVEDEDLPVNAGLAQGDRL